jgi:hypothetical protein
MRIDSSGNVGIGTSSPAAKLNVSRTDSTLIGLFSGTTRGARIGTNSTYSFIEGVDNTGSASYQPFMIGGADVRFTTSDVERMRIDSSGNLLVGTTTANGDGISLRPRVSAGSTSQINFNRASTATTGYPINFQNGNADVGYISMSNTAVAYVTSSDYRLKNNQAPLTGSGAFIDALKPKTWTWTADGSTGVGFIAHEVQEVSPNSVVGEKDAVDEQGNPKYQGMEYGSAEFIANIIAELQDLRKRVATLESK